MLVALWVVSSLLGLVTGFSLVDGADALRFSRITGPVQFALVGALIIVLTSLCGRISSRILGSGPVQPRYGRAKRHKRR